MNKEIILETLKGKRFKRVFQLIVNAYNKVYEIKLSKKDIKLVWEEYKDDEDYIEDKTDKYLLVEHFNFPEGFHFRAYDEFNSDEKMYNDYFSDCEGQDSFGEILLVDMEEFKCYLLNKEVKYPRKEVKTNG